MTCKILLQGIVKEVALEVVMLHVNPFHPPDLPATVPVSCSQQDRARVNRKKVCCDNPQYFPSSSQQIAGHIHSGHIHFLGLGKESLEHSLNIFSKHKGDNFLEAKHSSVPLTRQGKLTFRILWVYPHLPGCSQHSFQSSHSAVLAPLFS